MKENVRHALNAASLADVLQLIRSEQVGPRTFYNLVNKFNSVAEALKQLPNLAAQRKRTLKLADRKAVEAEIEATHANGAQFLVAGTEGYPERLLQLHDAPPVLIIKGDAAKLKAIKTVGLVGARNASAHGCTLARQIAKAASDAGYITISGLARGIDGAAHSASLETGTIGVVANGIDQFYPPEHQKLSELMVEKGGCIITEQPFGHAPHARAFPARNRLIAALAQGVVVLEAAHKSGSLITAHLALELGREVMAVPGSPLDARCQGTNQLLKDGATMVTSSQDVLQALAQQQDRLPTPPAQKPLHFSQADEIFAREESWLADDALDAWELDEEPAPEFEAQPAVQPSQISHEEAMQKVLGLLSYTMIDMEQLAINSGLSAAQLHSTVLELELAGQIQRGDGQRVALKASA